MLAFLKRLGPGLVTGAADDDPSGIATYSQAGAQYGNGLLWSLLLTLPLMIAIQAVCARIGRATGRGLAGNVRLHYPPWLLYLLVNLLLAANTINIAADIAAMGDALRLVMGRTGAGGVHGEAIVFGLLSLLFQLFVPYQRVAQILKWLTTVLLAYVAIVVTVRIPWGEVIAQTLLPSLSARPEYLLTLVGVLGTTISPYLFFWQASQEVEEQKLAGEAPLLVQPPAAAPAHLRRIAQDTAFGMTFSNVIAFFIMLSAAATLHVHGITDIQTSAQAAEALRPIAGDFTFLLFSIGIIGTGLLAVPVLAGSAAYACAEAFQWRGGLNLRPLEARGFYGIIGAATIIGVGLGFTPLDPVRGLYWSAVINGVVAVPMMALILRLGGDAGVMGHLAIRGRLKFFGWLATLVMALAAGGLLFSALR